MRRIVLAAALLVLAAGCDSKSTPTAAEPGPPPEPKTKSTKSADGKEVIVTTVPE